MIWDTVIGLEVHAQLATSSKLFSGSSTHYGAPPNSQTSYIDAGLPGVLPVINQQAVTMAIQFGLAIGAQINDLSFFERKNYFYPDLPKGYQISQFQRPIVSDGKLDIPVNGMSKTVTIERAHLEEDAGKSLHDVNPYFTAIDLNRAGIPLLEIVTTPCLYSAEEVIAYLKTLHQLLRFLKICDGNMQEGSFRCDVNISLKSPHATQLGTRTELKNLNSFKFIEKAIRYEQARHQTLLESGGTIIQETRLFCPDTETTQALRSKENEQDYRYFPDPDLLPIPIPAKNIQKLRETMPKLPQQIEQDLRDSAEWAEEDIRFLLSSPALYDFFSAVKAQTKADEKMILNWLKGPYLALLNERNQSWETVPVPVDTIAELLTHLHQKTFPNSIARQYFQKLAEGGTLDELLKNTPAQQDSQALEELIRNLIQQYPEQALAYRQGKTKLLAFFVGQVMKETKGQANPENINELLKAWLLRS